MHQPGKGSALQPDPPPPKGSALGLDGETEGGWDLEELSCWAETFLVRRGANVATCGQQHWVIHMLRGTCLVFPSSFLFLSPAFDFSPHLLAFGLGFSLRFSPLAHRSITIEEQGGRLSALECGDASQKSSLGWSTGEEIRRRKEETLGQGRSPWTTRTVFYYYWSKTSPLTHGHRNGR